MSENARMSHKDKTKEAEQDTKQETQSMQFKDRYSCNKRIHNKIQLNIMILITLLKGFRETEGGINMIQTAVCSSSSSVSSGKTWHTWRLSFQWVSLSVWQTHTDKQGRIQTRHVISQFMYIGISVVFGLSNENQNHKVIYDNSVFCVCPQWLMFAVSQQRGNSF